MPKSYDQTRINAVLNDLETNRFHENVGTVFGRRFNMHHYTAPNEVAALAVFQSVIQPALATGNCKDSSDFSKTAVSMGLPTPLRPHVWRSLSFLHEAGVVTEHDNSRDTTYSLTLRGKEFDPCVEIYKESKLAKGSLGATATGAAAAIGLSYVGGPILLAVAAWGAGGMASLQLGALRDAINAQTVYDTQTTGR